MKFVDKGIGKLFDRICIKHLNLMMFPKTQYRSLAQSVVYKNHFCESPHTLATVPLYKQMILKDVVKIKLLVLFRSKLKRLVISNICEK